MGIYENAGEEEGGDLLRTQDCRERLAWILAHCPIGEDGKREIENALKECAAHPEISGLSTHAIQPLIRERDPEIKEKAISSISKALESGKDPLTGKFTQKITEKDVQRVIGKAREEVRVPTFNATNDNIEWAKWSWNPVTGCKHGCPYCYARDIANRFYKEKFVPTFRPERLDAPKNTKVPEQAKTDAGYKNVFVCSMADLFGDWVPQEWIDQVFDAIRKNPQWNFLLLTKNPKRYVGLDFPDNTWIGTTVDCQTRAESAEKAFQEMIEYDDSVLNNVRFLSCEPLLEPLRFNDLALWSWLIIGGCSGNSQTPASQPDWYWVELLMNQARDPYRNGDTGLGLKVYFKPNLTIRPREYPEGH